MKGNLINQAKNQIFLFEFSIVKWYFCTGKFYKSITNTNINLLNMNFWLFKIYVVGEIPYTKGHYEGDLGIARYAMNEKDLVSGKFVVLFFRIVVSPLVYTPVCFLRQQRAKTTWCFLLFSLSRPLVDTMYIASSSMKFPRREKDVFSNKRTREVDRIDRKFS